MSLATTSDVAARLGRDLATTETTAVEKLIGWADAIIAREGRVAVADLDPDETPDLVGLEVDMVCRALANPQGVRSLTEALGQHSSTVNFRDLPDGGGLLLTKDERRDVRKAFGVGTFTALTLETPFSGTTADVQPELPLP